MLVEPSDVELARFQTDDTDGLITCGILSTTQESFSEHAWDPYQVCDVVALSGLSGFVLKRCISSQLIMTFP